MFERGYWTIATVRGTAIRLHWSLAVGALLFSGRAFAPAFWGGFLVLVLGHEVGHAWLIRRYGYRVHSLDLTGFGGMCRWTGGATDYERAVIAWGGVLVQGALLVVAALLVWVFGHPTNAHLDELADLFLRANLMLIGLNLLPVEPLDGARAWGILRYLNRSAWPRGRRDNAYNAYDARNGKNQQTSKPRHDKVSGPGFSQPKGAGVAAKSPDFQADQSSSEARQLADELLRLSKQAAEARRKRRDN